MEKEIFAGFLPVEFVVAGWAYIRPSPEFYWARAFVGRSELAHLIYRFSGELEEIDKKRIRLEDSTPGPPEDELQKAIELEKLDVAEAAELGQFEALIEEGEEPTGCFSRAVNPWVFCIAFVCAGQRRRTG